MDKECASVMGKTNDWKVLSFTYTVVYLYSVYSCTVSFDFKVTFVSYFFIFIFSYLFIYLLISVGFYSSVV